MGKLYFPARFRTQADAELFERCVKSGETFPEEKWVFPFVNRMNQARGAIEAVENPEYRDAPFEVPT